MKIFLYENVGPRALNRINASTNQNLGYELRETLGLRRVSKKTADHEFQDILDSTLTEMELKDLILANQMALRRAR